jgi:hypothetical protein
MDHASTLANHSAVAASRFGGIQRGIGTGIDGVWRIA